MSTSAHADRPDPRAPLRVTVLCGGPSAEREVSLQSGAAIAAALAQRGHGVHVADIGPDDLAGLDEPADVIFPALHGPFGEDGALQRIMESRGLRFVGSGSAASALAMDKAATKRCAAGAGIDTPAFEVWDAPRAASGEPPAFALPVFVKPVDQGSSVGAGAARDAATLHAIARECAARFGRALVEQLVAGQELTVGIVGDAVLAPIVVRPKEGFYDYHAKYVANDTTYLVGSGAPQAVLAQAQALSRRVFDAVGCRHLGRVDWLVDADQRLWFLEVNTLPGFTSHSLVPKAAAHAGIGFDDLCDRLVRMAYEDAR